MQQQNPALPKMNNNFSKYTDTEKGSDPQVISNQASAQSQPGRKPDCSSGFKWSLDGDVCDVRKLPYQENIVSWMTGREPNMSIQ